MSMSVRRMEVKKIDKLHVSLEILRTSLTNNQRAVKEAKSKYFSDLARNYQRPKILFQQLT